MRTYVLLRHTTTITITIVYFIVINYKMSQWYFIRFTSDNTSKQSLADFLGTPFLISKEYSRRMKLHYHVVHQSSLNKEQLKNMFYDKFPDEPRGVATLKIDTIGDTLEDWEKVSTYTVKDGDFIHSIEFDERISTFIENSYKKPQSYGIQLKEIIDQTTEEEYHKVNWQKLKRQIMLLRAEFHLEIYVSKIEALVLSIQVSMNNNLVENYFLGDSYKE